MHPLSCKFKVVHVVAQPFSWPSAGCPAAGSPGGGAAGGIQRQAGGVPQRVRAAGSVSALFKSNSLQFQWSWRHAVQKCCWRRTMPSRRRASACMRSRQRERRSRLSGLQIFALPFGKMRHHALRQAPLRTGWRSSERAPGSGREPLVVISLQRAALAVGRQALRAALEWGDRQVASLPYPSENRCSAGTSESLRPYDCVCAASSTLRSTRRCGTLLNGRRCWKPWTRRGASSWRSWRGCRPPPTSGSHVNPRRSATLDGFSNSPAIISRQGC